VPKVKGTKMAVTSCISLAQTWPAMLKLYRFCFRNIAVTTDCYNHVAPGRALAQTWVKEFVD